MKLHFRSPVFFSQNIIDIFCLGNWMEDRKQGQGSQTWPDGRQYKGEWNDDRPMNNSIQSPHDGQRRERPDSISKTIGKTSPRS